MVPGKQTRDVLPVVNQFNVKTMVMLGDMSEVEDEDKQESSTVELSTERLNEEDACFSISNVSVKRKKKGTEKSMRLREYRYKGWPLPTDTRNLDDIYSFVIEVQKHQQKQGNPQMLICYSKGNHSFALFVVLLNIIERMDAEKLVNVPCAFMKAQQWLEKFISVEGIDLCFKIAKLHQKSHDSYYNYH